MKLAALVVALAGCSHASRWPAGGPFRLGDEVVPVRYALDLELDRDARWFEGAVTIDVDVRTPADHIWLNGRELKILEASVEQHDVTTPAHADVAGAQYLALVPGAPLVRGPARLRLRFRGHPSGNERGLFTRRVDGEVYTFTQ